MNDARMDAAVAKRSLADQARGSVMTTDGKESEFNYAIAGNECALGRLEDVLNRLAVRLSPVIEDRPPDVKEDSKSACLGRSLFSHVGRSIETSTQRIRNMEDRLSTILDHLAI